MLLTKLVVQSFLCPIWVIYNSNLPFEEPGGNLAMLGHHFNFEFTGTQTVTTSEQISLQGLFGTRVVLNLVSWRVLRVESWRRSYLEPPWEPDPPSQPLPQNPPSTAAASQILKAAQN